MWQQHQSCGVEAGVYIRQRFTVLSNSHHAILRFSACLQVTPQGLPRALPHSSVIHRIDCAVLLLIMFC